ncbi:hypothetical protein HRI_004556800 [Hibiscus trionum]|uniref:Uncharacterized protein n=1 Tax=Hibiscus trionum TaxID=183268 RepID=A0A9W7MTN7_HIBTR|nr:hypothetical protein HRI_004556800 [Hibiscus trionum]
MRVDQTKTPNALSFNLKPSNRQPIYEIFKNEPKNQTPKLLSSSISNIALLTAPYQKSVTLLVWVTTNQLST